MKRLLFLSFTALHAWGACHVITPSGSGTNSGNDWNNACAGFTGNCSTTSGMVRGDSYYLGKGSYSAPTLSRANSGTTKITIKSPTDADNCTSTGYVSGTHKGQAVISGSIFVSSDYWTLDGQYGTETPVTGKGTYGIKVAWSGGTSQMQIACASGCTGSTFRYLEIVGSNGSDTGCDVGLRILGYNQTPNTHDVLIEHNYVYRSNNNIGLQFTDTVTVSYNIMSENWSTGGCHGENLPLNGPSNTTVKHNRFIDCAGTGCIATPSSVSGAIDTLYIYGNVFYDSGRAGTCPGSFSCPGNGMIAIIDSVDVNNLKIYNNTIANWTTGHTSGGTTLTFFDTGSGGTITNAEAKNNLFYNNVSLTLGVGTCASNSYYSTTRSSSACTGDQTGGAGNPFVNSTSDFHLTADTSSWASLASPFNVDPDGVTRSSSRGAFQFVSGGSSAPTVTTSAVSSVGTTTATGNGNVTSDGGDTVTARGVCWSTSPSPTLSGSCAAAGAGGTGTYTASMTGLSSNTAYYVAAYATNGVGTSYGSDVTFTTNASTTATAGMGGKSGTGGKASIH